MTRATESTIWTTSHGATWCAAAHGDGDGVAVLVGHITDGGERSVTVLALDARGVRRAGLKEVTLPDTSAYLAKCVVSEGRVLLAVTRRREEELNGGGTRLLHDHPSFIDLGTDAGEPRVVSSRDDLDASEIAAAARGSEIAWVLRLVTWSGVTATSHLAYAHANGVDAPDVRRTDIPCAEVAHVVGDRGALALVATKTQADVWALDRSGPPRKLLDAVASVKNRRTISSVRLARLRDGFVFVWYVTPNGSYDGGGGLYARTASTDLADLGAVTRLARVDEAEWNAWRADDVGDGALVLFGTGDPGDRLKQLRVRVRADIESDARTIPGRLPVALAVTREGAVAITAKHANGGRKTTLVSRLLLI